MTDVFDTSSLMAVLLDEDSPDIEVLFDEHVLDLSFYEAGNVVWKATYLQERIEETERERLVELLGDLRLEVVVHDLPSLGMEPVMTTARECDVTFYDAAHVRCAEMLDGSLVTEDKGLRSAADGVVSVCDLSDRQ